MKLGPLKRRRIIANRSGTPADRVLVLAAIILLLSPWVGWGGEAANAQNELKQVRSRIDSVRRNINADVRRRDSLSAELRATELDIQSVQQRLGTIREQRVAAENKLAALQRDRAETQQRIESERNTLASELRVAYMNGRDERIKLLLNQQDPAQLGRMLAYYSYFGQARADRIATIGDTLAHLDLLTDSIAAEAARLAEIEETRKREIAELANARQRRSQTLASVQTRIRSRNDELSRLENNARTLERLVEELRRAVQEFPRLAAQPFERVRGRLPWPVKGKVLARFGQLRAGGPLKWQGLLIDTRRGSQVRAPFHGRVVYADWLPGMGLLLVLDHGGGYMSLYGHNEQLFKAVGDRVAPGDVISTSGDSGGNANSGLYMEIRKGGEPVDPLPWLARP